MTRRRIVVTGIGAITPIGLDISQFWEGLISGKNGVTPIKYFDASKFDTQFAAQASNFNPEEYFSGPFVHAKSLKLRFHLALLFCKR